MRPLGTEQRDRINVIESQYGTLYQNQTDAGETRASHRGITR
jgi:hypothetical protein